MVIIVLTFPVATLGFEGEEKLGLGSYSNQLPPGATDVQETIYQTPQVDEKMPTNDWWSNVAWDQYSTAQYPHPLAVKNQEDGFRIYNPSHRITGNDACVCGWINDIHDFTVGHSNVNTFPDTKVDNFNDWFVSTQFQEGNNTMDVTYGHGSPFVFFTFTGGNPEIDFYTSPTIWSGDANSPVLGITIEGSHYGLFGPSGSTWDGIGTSTLTNHLNDKDYFSIVALPDQSEATLAKFQEYAYSHVTDTKVDWHYDETTSEVITTYQYTTTAKEGSNNSTIFALYPHQWKNTSQELLDYTYNSVRGLMKTAEGSQFETKMKFTGVLPSLPNEGSYDLEQLSQFIDEAEEEDYTDTPDTYWIGKRLGKLATLAPIAEQAGDSTAADNFRTEIKSRLEDWFTASDSQGNLNTSELFYYNDNWGTLIGYPDSFGSAEELNDHHFHYGYFIKAAAEIARVDRNWAEDDQWGQMVKLLIRDIANWDRNDNQFPFLRNFDPYAGHSWASGHARFDDGNNNESSSEAMNAWAGLILWGEATNDQTIRDLGIYLYTTEMNAINEYWFDVDETNHHEDFTRSTASMIWGGKTVGDAVWWTANPEEVHGINWLPITGASLYLTHHPAYTEKNYQALINENNGTDFDVWEDLIYMYRAISNIEDAKSLYESNIDNLTPEAGNSKAHLYHWIYNLDVLGNADPSVTADYPINAVFNKDGNKTYVVYNLTNEQKTVHFSDGYTLTAEPNSFTTSTNDDGNEDDDNGSEDPNQVILPAKIEAEDYQDMYGIQHETTTDIGGGENIGYFDVGDWLDYTIEVPAEGDYYIDYRVASNTSNGQFQLLLNDDTIDTIDVPNTGGWQSWTTLSSTIHLPEGVHQLRLYATGFEFNINWFEISTLPADDEEDENHSTDDYTVNVQQDDTNNQLFIAFTPTTEAEYVDIHYVVNDSTQQNFRMTNNGGNWQQTINNFSQEDHLEYWFTYEKEGLQYDSPHYFIE
ncbi:glycosyl hydrolase [Gracilibacillus lacisalsi]|uniref:glycosyl hydrolase n=1 Tax=Gracilibacillus lacisalsi TaxID=393087 RepID=UPI00052670E7|nr:glycosyl hydrolase [Gracilibacillus lacisalsi]